MSREADQVVSLELARHDGSRLPAWSPGAHVELILPSGRRRQYSLCGRPEHVDSYKVAVLRTDSGRGGSAEIHDSALVGRNVRFSGPRNHFPLEPASAYLFLAGGIGITPILPMVRRAAEAGIPWALHYGGRRVATMAFVAELSQFGEDGVHLYPEDETGRMDLEQIIAASPADCEVYGCGPESMLREISRVCGAEGTRRVLHTERFAPSNTDRIPVVSDHGEFEVELHRTGVVLLVPAEKSILEVVRIAVPTVASSCEQGFCGSCETTVLGGTPLHRDEVLSPEERARGETMMICVSRAESPVLVLDL